MKRLNHICIITAKYPTEADRTELTFVQQLAWSMADEGKRISVICPLPTNLNHKYRSVPDKTIEKTYNGNEVTVYCPKFFGLGQKTLKPTHYNTARMTAFFFEKAVKHVIEKMEAKPDALYGHFIAPSGITACKLAKKYGLPSYIAYGESSTWSIDHMGRKRVAKAIDNVTGIISVSTKNADELISLGLVDQDKIEVFPNGYNPDRFSPKDREAAREYFGFPKNEHIVAFVGHFIKRKGIDKLCEAVKKVPNVKLICAGKGDLQPYGDQVLFAKPVNPSELSMFYSAADVFVLPTLNEGCCNAIIEAMACGLPIISSDRLFNYDILDSSNAILIEPEDANAISEAIKTLAYDSCKRMQMANASLEKAKNLMVAQRALNIVDYMERMAE